MSYVPNGIDCDRFRRLTPPQDRTPHQVATLYHPAVWKGARDGLAALAQARAAVPHPTAMLLGTTGPPELPPWISYQQLPSPPELEALYNRCAMFLHPSHAEGWPLPPAEALPAGAALVGFANGGVSDYAYAGETALLAPAGDVGALAALVVRLCQQPDERIRLARVGSRAIRHDTGERAAPRMAPVLSVDPLGRQAATAPVAPPDWAARRRKAGPR